MVASDFVVNINALLLEMVKINRASPPIGSCAPRTTCLLVAVSAVKVKHVTY